MPAIAQPVATHYAILSSIINAVQNQNQHIIVGASLCWKPQRGKFRKTFQPFHPCRCSTLMTRIFHQMKMSKKIFSKIIFICILIMDLLVSSLPQTSVLFMILYTSHIIARLAIVYASPELRHFVSSHAGVSYIFVKGLDIAILLCYKLSTRQYRRFTIAA